MKDLQLVNVTNLDSKPFTKMFLTWLLIKGQDRISPSSMSCHWSLSILPENITKVDVFCCFQGI